MDAEALRSAALAVLRTNDLGEWTKPAPRLYPHQWSWDSAVIAIGLAQVDLDRALRELETLFAAQWSDGRVPHIVFNPHAADYFPGAEWWASASTSRHAPRAPATSGLIQPPVHALALLHIYRRATRTHPPPAPAGGPPSPAAALQFTSAPSREPSRGPADGIDERGLLAGIDERGLLARIDERGLLARIDERVRQLYPRVLAWHRYLAAPRDPHDDGLLVIYHPWESRPAHRSVRRVLRALHRRAARLTRAVLDRRSGAGLALRRSLKPRRTRPLALGRGRAGGVGA